MPECGVNKLSHEAMLSEEEMIMAVKAGVSLGIKKVRITGGEPLIKKNILSICKNISNIPGIEELCITTNGTLLKELGGKLIDSGVTRLNISLDTLDPDKYRSLTRGGDLDRVLSSIDYALDLGFKRIKINSVLIGGINDNEIEQLSNLTVKKDLDVRFIELMPMYNNQEFGKEAYIPASYVLEKLPQLEKTNTNELNTNGPATIYKLPESKGYIGLISPISNHFCSSCNRLRITSDGMVKPCLHSSDEISIKGLSYEEIVNVLKSSILKKPKCHEEMDNTKISKANRSMNKIGG